MRSFVMILSLFWLQTQSSLFNALAASPMRRIYSGLELLLLDCTRKNRKIYNGAYGEILTKFLLPRYVNSSTGSTVLPSTIIGDGVGPEPRFWIFVLVQETRRPNLEASSSIETRALCIPEKNPHHQRTEAEADWSLVQAWTVDCQHGYWSVAQKT